MLPKLLSVTINYRSFIINYYNTLMPMLTTMLTHATCQSRLLRSTILKNLGYLKLMHLAYEAWEVRGVCRMQYCPDSEHVSSTLSPPPLPTFSGGGGGMLLSQGKYERHISQGKPAFYSPRSSVKKHFFAVLHRCNCKNR